MRHDALAVAFAAEECRDVILNTKQSGLGATCACMVAIAETRVSNVSPKDSISTCVQIARPGVCSCTKIQAASAVSYAGDVN